MSSRITRVFTRHSAALALGAALLHSAPAAAQTSAPLCCAEPPSRMVGWWPLDETAGPVAADVSATPQNGTWTGGPVSGSGKVHGALQFNGTSYVQVASAPKLQFGRGDFSMDAWLWLPDATGTRAVLDKRTFTGSQVRGYHVFVTSGRLGVQLADGPFTNYVASATLPLNRWVHIAVTVDRDDPAGVRFYYDGTLVGTPGNPTARSGTLDNPAPLRIGGHSASPGAGLRGKLDEVELFDRVLWPSEIVTLVRADSVGKCRARCGPLDVTISSAPQQWTVVSVPAGASIPASGHPFLVTPHPAWKLNDTGPWMSANSAAYGDGQAGWYEYEYRFCLCPGFSNPKLDLWFRVDDSYELLLNPPQNPAITTPTAGFAQNMPGNVVLTGGFVPGTNVLRLRVHNDGGPTGFALTGGLTATAGRCPTAQP